MTSEAGGTQVVNAYRGEGGGCGDDVLNIYPRLALRCAILWTDAPSMPQDDPGTSFEQF